MESWVGDYAWENVVRTMDSMSEYGVYELHARSVISGSSFNSGRRRDYTGKGAEVEHKQTLCLANAPHIPSYSFAQPPAALLAKPLRTRSFSFTLHSHLPLNVTKFYRATLGLYQHATHTQ